MRGKGLARSFIATSHNADMPPRKSLSNISDIMRSFSFRTPAPLAEAARSQPVCSKPRFTRCSSFARSVRCPARSSNRPSRRKWSGRFAPIIRKVRRRLMLRTPAGAMDPEGMVPEGPEGKGSRRRGRQRFPKAWIPKAGTRAAVRIFATLKQRRSFGRKLLKWSVRAPDPGPAPRRFDLPSTD